MSPSPGSVPDAAVSAVPGVTEVAVYSDEDKAPPMPHRRAVIVLVILAIAAFTFSANETSVMGVISLMAEDMNRSEAAIGLMTTVFAIVNMVLSFPAALLLKRLPRRSVLTGTVLALVVGMTLVATAQSFAALLIGRAVSGAGHAAFWAIVTPTVAGMFTSKERGKSVSRLLLGGSLSGIIGLPLVTFLAQHAGWRAPYWVLIGLALAVAAGIFFLMPSFRAEHGTAARGLIPSMPIFVRVLIVCALTIVAQAITWTFITPFATGVAGFSKSAVPTLLLIGGMSGVAAMYAVGRFVDRYPVKTVAFGLACFVTLWALMSTLGHFKPVLVLCVILQGLSTSVLVASMVMWAIRHAPGSTDTANGIYATAFSAGNASGSLGGSALLAAAGAAWLPVASLVVSIAAATLVWTMRGASMRGLRMRLRVESPTRLIKR